MLVPTIARAVEVLIGLFFVATAAAKAMNVEAFAVQISLYGVVKEPNLVMAAAYSVIGIETLLGAAFLAGWRLKGAMYAAAALLTIVFSGLILYAWRVKGIEDCGCFGEYVKMGPRSSLLKNLALLAVLAFGWYGTRDMTRVGVIRAGGPLKVGAFAVSLILVGVLLVVNN